MKTRIALDSFENLSFPVVPVTRPVGDEQRSVTPALILRAEWLSRPVSAAARRFLARYAGCALPRSLNDWLASRGALTIRRPLASWGGRGRDER